MGALQLQLHGVLCVHATHIGVGQAATTAIGGKYLAAWPYSCAALRCPLISPPLCPSQVAAHCSSGCVGLHILPGRGSWSGAAAGMRDSWACSG